MMSDNIINCWNSVGVWGREKPRCPVLDTVIHCRNCDKYISAGRKALERPIADDYSYSSLQYAEEKSLQKPADSTSVMILRLGDEWFALPSSRCQLISEARPIHSVPHQKHNLIKGVVNLSGEIQLCFSIGALLGVKESVEDHSGNHRGLYDSLVVMVEDAKRYVFPVTEFRGLHEYSKNELQSVPATIKSDTASFLTGVICLDNLNVGCIDSELLFSSLDKAIR